MSLTREEMESCLGPLDRFMGVELLEASSARVVARLPVTPRLHHPGGLVDGGVYATLAELTASIGANVALPADASAVGGSNETHFLRGVREGVLQAVAVPLGTDEPTQAWKVRIVDERERLVAYATVRMFNLADARFRGTPT